VEKEVQSSTGKFTSCPGARFRRARKKNKKSGRQNAASASVSIEHRDQAIPTPPLPRATWGTTKKRRGGQEGGERARALDAVGVLFMRTTQQHRWAAWADRSVCPVCMERRTPDARIYDYPASYTMAGGWAGWLSVRDGRRRNSQKYLDRRTKPPPPDGTRAQAAVAASSNFHKRFLSGDNPDIRMASTEANPAQESAVWKAFLEGVSPAESE